MKKYYVDGKEITAEKAERIQRLNKTIIEAVEVGTMNFSQMAAIKFVTVIEK